MKILLVNGSHKHGNTDTATKKLLMLFKITKLESSS